MPIQVNILQAWKHTVRVRTRITGVWRELPQAYVKVNGEWKSLYSFFWESGEWSECSSECGGGIQIRNNRCKRSDGQYYDEAICTRFIGEQPELRQICNTHDCVMSECLYEANMTYISWVTRNYGTSDFPTYGTEVNFYESGSNIYTTFLFSGEGTDRNVDINECKYYFGDCVSCPGKNNIYKLCKIC